MGIIILIIAVLFLLCLRFYFSIEHIKEKQKRLIPGTKWFLKFTNYSDSLNDINFKLLSAKIFELKGIKIIEGKESIIIEETESQKIYVYDYNTFLTYFDYMCDDNTFCN